MRRRARPSRASSRSASTPNARCSRSKRVLGRDEERLAVLGRAPDEAHARRGRRRSGCTATVVAVGDRQRQRAPDRQHARRRSRAISGSKATMRSKFDRVDLAQLPQPAVEVLVGGGRRPLRGSGSVRKPTVAARRPANAPAGRSPAGTRPRRRGRKSRSARSIGSGSASRRNSTKRVSKRARLRASARTPRRTSTGRRTRAAVVGRSWRAWTSARVASRLCRRRHGPRP